MVASDVRCLAKKYIFGLSLMHDGSPAQKTDSPAYLSSVEFIHVHFEPVVTHGLHYTVF